MGTGYTRNDTANNIADGNVINAADFDGEYDAIEAAFNSSTGHTHDGTSAEGAPITVLGPSQEFVASSSEVKPSTNAGLDLGTSALKFKDLYLDGTAYIDGLGGNLLVDTTNALQFRDAQLSINSSADGQLDIAADTTAKITSPEVIVTDDFRLQSDAAILTFGADDDVTVTHVADTGLDAKAASGFVLKLQTGDTTVESGNTVGKISFNAPDEAGGTDAILVGAEIEAAAEATFSSTDNSTALVFKTNTSAAATERMRIKSDGDIVTQGANYTMTWDHSADTLRFADNAKATFGASDDLQIFHDGSNSIITDTGTGNLILKTDGNNIQFEDNSGNDIFKVTPTATNIYHGTSGIRLQTTTEGIDVTGDISVGNLNIITNTISSTDTNGDINLSPNGTGTVVINTDLDVDNININGNSIISTDTNGDINITPNGTGKVNIAGGFVPSEINLTSTDAGATAGPVFELHRNSASPADNDAIGAIDFAGQDSGGNKVIYASIDATIMDATDATEDGRLDFITQVAGSNYSRMRFDPAETVFNEAGIDVNFRVESDDNPNMLFVDANENRVGIGTDSPSTQLEVKGDTFSLIRVNGSNTNNAGIDFGDTDDVDIGRIRYNNTDDEMQFWTNNAQRVVIDSVGQVGIGTGSPNAPIDLGDTSGQKIILWSNSNIKYGVSVETSELRLFAEDQAIITFGGMDRSDGTTFTEHMRIESDGEIRILNNNSSAQALQLRTTSSAGRKIAKSIARNDSGGTNPMVQMDMLGYGTNGYIGQMNMYMTPSDVYNSAQIDVFSVYATTGAIFNEDGVSYVDFRVESDNTAYGIYLDAGADRVGLLGNRTSDITKLSVGDLTQGTGQATENGTTDVIIYSDSAIASNTILALDGGSSGFSGTNEAGIDHHLDFRSCAFLSTGEGGPGIEQHVGARISMSKDKSWNETSAGTGIYSSLIFYTQGGTLTSPSLKENLRLTRTSAIFNDDSGDVDFRVESDNAGHMLFVDAGNDSVLFGMSSAASGGFSSTTRFAMNAIGTNCLGLRVTDNSSSSISLIDFRDGDDQRMGEVVGNASNNTVSYGTSSDRSQKENDRPIPNPVDRVAALNPVLFDWISDGTSSEGFIAQELERDTQLGMDAVRGEDGEKTVDYGKLTPLLTAALQEALVKIEVLEARITALENA